MCRPVKPSPACGIWCARVGPGRPSAPISKRTVGSGVGAPSCCTTVRFTPTNFPQSPWQTAGPGRHSRPSRWQRARDCAAGSAKQSMCSYPAVRRCSVLLAYGCESTGPVTGTSRNCMGTTTPSPRLCSWPPRRSVPPDPPAESLPPACSNGSPARSDWTVPSVTLHESAIARRSSSRSPTSVKERKRCRRSTSSGSVDVMGCPNRYGRLSGSSRLAAAATWMRSGRCAAEAELSSKWMERCTLRLSGGGTISSGRTSSPSPATPCFGFRLSSCVARSTSSLINCGARSASESDHVAR